MSDQLFSVENKICIVTGGLGQIGKNFVQELWKRGARVAVWGRTVNDERIAKTLGEEALKTSALRFYSVDITKKEEMNAASGRSMSMRNTCPSSGSSPPRPGKNSPGCA